MSVEPNTTDEAQTETSVVYDNDFDLTTFERFFITHHSLNWERVDYDWANEYIYEAPVGDGTFTLRCYSSVDKRGDDGRGRGNDRIRFILLLTETKRPVMAKAVQHNRVKKTPGNERIWLRKCNETANDLASRPTHNSAGQCPNCGGHLHRVSYEDDGDYKKAMACARYMDGRCDDGHFQPVDEE